MAGVTRALVGRDEELELLSTTVRGARSSMVIAGPAGVGKTRLLEELLGGMAADGIRTVLARATRSTATIPFGPFAAWVPERVAETITDRLGVLSKTGRALLAGPDRVVVAVDDAHLLDDGSAALVLHLANQQDATVVVTVRTAEPCPDAVAALWKDGMAERIDLQPLSDPETVELVEQLVGRPMTRGIHRRICQLTGGLPLYVREVVRAGLEQGVIAEREGGWYWRGHLAGTGRLGDLLGGTLGRASPEQRLALELLAVAEPVPADVLAQLVPLDVVAGAEQEGFVATEQAGDDLMVRLSHPLYGEVLRAELPGLAARRCRQRLAVAATEVGWHDREPLRVASWWIDSGADGAPADTCVTAALRALDSADWELAERLALAAEDAGGGIDATMARAAACVAAGRLDEAEVLLDELSGRPLDSQGVADLAVARARNQYWFRAQHARAVDGLVEAAEGLTAPSRGHVLAYAAYLAAMACDPATAARLAEEAAAEAGDSVAFRVEALAVASFAWTAQGRTGAGVGAAETAIPHLAADLGLDPNPTALLPAAYVFGRTLQGRLADAAATAQAILTLSHADDGFTMMRGLAHTLVGRVALFEGRLDLAREHGLEGLSILRSSGLPAHWPAATVIAGAAQLGDTEVAADAAAWVDSTVDPVAVYGLELDLARAWFASARGERTAARDLAGEVARRAAGSGARAFELLALVDLARLGAADRCRQRLDELSEVVEGSFAPAAASFAHGLAERDADVLDGASAALGDVGAVLLAAEASAAAAAAHRGAGRRGSAITSSTRARRLAARTGGARTPLLREVEAVSSLGALTDREREVVMLAGRGLTNREIAGQLYVSMRTINTHLGHAYAKLGVNDRTQLASLLEVGDPALA